MIPKAAWKELIDYLTEVTTNPMDFALTGKRQDAVFEIRYRETKFIFSIRCVVENVDTFYFHTEYTRFPTLEMKPFTSNLDINRLKLIYQDWLRNINAFLDDNNQPLIKFKTIYAPPSIRFSKSKKTNFKLAGRSFEYSTTVVRTTLSTLFLLIVSAIGIAYNLGKDNGESSTDMVKQLKLDKESISDKLDIAKRSIEVKDSLITTMQLAQKNLNSVILERNKTIHSQDSINGILKNALKEKSNKVK
ncbi:MAG: hypothetical protein HOP08_17405 [Cyclobacteriaceae bacterium]|nr:hypothetical protein [Cyclobacteriaceae bacterium]